MASANVPDLRVTLDGTDLTGRIRPRLISLSIASKRGGDADQLDIAIDDTDGRMALPAAGKRLHVEIGWRPGGERAAGLVDMGDFLVDEIEHVGPPDTIVIRARSADFTSDLARRREKSWHDTTLGTVVAEVAGRHRLTARCAPALAGIAVKTLSQSRESDTAFLRRLGRDHDAVATIKRGTLIFAPIGSGATASGKPLPRLTIDRREGDRHSFRIAKREEAEGVTASWHDRAGAKKRAVTVGKADGARKLGRVYGSEAEAKRAAMAAKSRAARLPRSLDLTLALGRADIYPEQTATAAGYKAEIDAVAWLVSEVTHTVSDRGFTTRIMLESDVQPTS